MNGYPVVNLNGTSRESLLEQRWAAMDAISTALIALSECSPNGRDYQTAAKGEFEVARNLHSERFAFLDRLINELREEVMFIQDSRHGS